MYGFMIDVLTVFGVWLATTWVLLLREFSKFAVSMGQKVTERVEASLPSDWQDYLNGIDLSAVQGYLMVINGWLPMYDWMVFISGTLAVIASIRLARWIIAVVVGVVP